jgi:hypothetical protein
MPRSRIFGIYALLIIFALGAGLLVARLFGSSAALPSGYATPPVAASGSATAAPATAGTLADRRKC